MHEWMECTMSRVSFIIISRVSFPGGSDGKESACNAGHLGLIPGEGRKIPFRREWLPSPVFLPGEFHAQRHLVGYSPRVRHRVTESDTTEPLTNTFTFRVSITHTHISPPPPTQEFGQETLIFFLNLRLFSAKQISLGW